MHKVSCRWRTRFLDVAQAKAEFDLIVISNPQFAACHQQLLDLGVPASAILLFYQDPRAALVTLGPVRNFSARKRGTTDEYGVMPFQGKVLEDARDLRYGPVEAELAGNLLKLYLACRKALDAAGPVYQVGKNWEGFLRFTRGELYAAIRARDLRALHGLLAQFWRNGLGAGINGSAEAYRTFAALPEADAYASLRPYVTALIQGLGQDVDPADLALPPMGNPFGVRLGGALVHENYIMNYFRATSLSRLLDSHEAPVVAEIGGGAGYFALALLKQNPHITYIDFDLPEVLLVEAYVLSLAFPERRILYFDGSTRPLNRALFDAYDIILMPTCMLAQLEDESVDLFVNTISFGEMDLDMVGHFIREAERTTRGFFYHENLCEMNYDYENYPTDCFPVPEGFMRLFSAPSRWPYFAPSSPRHVFSENLYLKRQQ
jgi:hypothetical protein